MGIGIFSSTSFQDFVNASRRVKPDDALVLRDGHLEKLSPYEDDKSLNTRTWRAFHKAIRKSFTATHRNAITARYGLDFDKMVRSGHPLERRYVEYFGVGAASPYTFNLREQQGLFGGALNRCSPEQIHSLYRNATESGYLGTVQDPTDIYGGVRYAHEQFAYDYFHTDQARSNLFRGISELVSKDPNIPRLHPYYSRLEMGIISLLETDPNNATLEAVIPAPGDRDGAVDYYRVHRIISNAGLNAIALVPISDQSKLEPLLCFRCTKQTLGHHGSLDSNFENFNEHIGKSSYEACREDLDQLAKDPVFNRGKKFSVVCYSQGGGHAAYFMRDHWKEVKQYIGFNVVGSDATLVGELASEINALEPYEVPPKIYQHRNVGNAQGTEGDWVNKVGQRHLGHGIQHPNAYVAVYEWHIHDYPCPTNNIWDPKQLAHWLDFHAIRPMDTDREDDLKSKWDKRWKYAYKKHEGGAMVDRVLDTYNRDSTLEDLRHNIGYKLIYNLAVNAASWLDFLLRLFDIRFFNR